jgi:hypothetical protein
VPTFKNKPEVNDPFVKSKRYEVLRPKTDWKFRYTLPPAPAPPPASELEVESEEAEPQPAGVMSGSDFLKAD